MDIATVALCIAILGIFGQIVIFVSNSVRDYYNHIEAGDCPERPPFVIKLILSDPSRSYYISIRFIRMKLQQWFGAPLSGKALNLCTKIALLYPISLIVFTWIFGHSLEFPGKPLLPDVASPNWRTFWGLTLLLSIAILYWMCLGRPLYIQSYKRLLKKVGIRKLWQTSTIIQSTPIILIGIGTGIVSRNWSVGITCTILALVVLWVTLKFKSIVVGFAFGILLFSAATYFQFINSQITIFVLFVYLFLPLANAICDWFSWMFSRWLIAKIKPLTSPAKSMIIILFDLGLAILMTFMAAMIIAFSIGLLNVILMKIGLEEFPWREYLNASQESPFTEGALGTAMVFTTLLPTVFHMILAIGLFFLSSFRGISGLTGVGSTQTQIAIDKRDQLLPNKLGVAVSFSLLLSLLTTVILLMGLYSLISSQIGSLSAHLTSFAAKIIETISSLA